METIGGVSSEQGRVKFDMTLLDPTVLRQEDALACAIRTFEVHLNFPTSREGLLRELMEVHNCLGFVISGNALVVIYS